MTRRGISNIRRVTPGLLTTVKGSTKPGGDGGDKRIRVGGFVVPRFRARVYSCVFVLSAVMCAKLYRGIKSVCTPGVCDEYTSVNSVYAGTWVHSVYCVYTLVYTSVYTTNKGGNSMNIIIKENYEEMSRYAAKIIAGHLKKNPRLVLGLATGATPIGTYKELIRMHREGLDFSQAVTFNLDEYLGVGIDLSKQYHLDQSYARFMHEEFFAHINAKPENIHIPDGLAPDPEAFCRRYEEEIKRAGGIDLQVLGIGRDGHWAFNEPGSSLASRTRIQVLTKETLADNYESFYRQAGIAREKMPHFAITMGIGTILEARNILMLANGKKKAGVVAKALEGPVTSQVTASAIQLHSGEITVVLDREAASELKNIEYYHHAERIKTEREDGLRKTWTPTGPAN